MEAQQKYHMGDGLFDPQKAHPDDAHNTIMHLNPAGSRVLEPGCSSGYLSGYMEKSTGCRVTGLEDDPVATQIAKNRCSEVYTVDLDLADALDVAKTSAHYDVLLAGKFDYSDYDVMDHTHMRLYTRKTGRELLEQNGYTVENVLIAGSLVQNNLNAAARALKRAPFPLILPGLFAYEPIYIARPK
jgi:cyclopropane fatty-acyl-phospholipid synthase-like methyltransferase